MRVLFFPIIYMKLLLLKALLIIVLLVLLSCSEGYDFSQPSLGLGLRDYTCTEAWIEVQVGTNDKTAVIYIKQNGLAIKTLTVAQSQTILYFDTLRPNTYYTFDAVTNDGGREIKSNPVSFTTLDTTNHNFNWQTFSFGNHYQSALYDVTVIDENNIWAVGEIYMNDSSGLPDPTPYNAVHWNGSDWELSRIPTRTSSGSIVISPIKTIFSFDKNSIWTFSTAGSHSYWNGTTWSTEYVNASDDKGNKLYGTGNYDLYLACSDGVVLVYNGADWKRFGNVTNVSLLDIYSTKDGKTIWACGYTNDNTTSSLIRIKDGVPVKIFEDLSESKNNGYTVGPLSGVWSDNNYRVLLMNWNGIYLQQNSSQLFLEKELARFSKPGFGIDGTAYNNVFVCGKEFVGHWNGLSYTEYPYLFQSYQTFRSVKAYKNTVCVVGSGYIDADVSRGVVVIGER